jgi:NitT/TauT family transport system substrate-binding protein
MKSEPFLNGQKVFTCAVASCDPPFFKKKAFFFEKKKQKTFVHLAVCALMLLATTARAEVAEVRFAQQFSMGYLQFNMMAHRNLLEKHAAALGIPNLKVSWRTFNGPDNMNDALLSDSVDVVSGGVPGLVTLWAKTAGTKQEVRGIIGLGRSPILLNCRAPNVKSIQDLGPADKIAMPAVKVSIQAIILEMAAAKAWGDKEYDKLDPLTLSLSPPDATTGLLSGSGSFDCAFTVPPFQNLQLRDKAIHTVLDSTSLLGDATTTLAWTSKNFHDANPTVYRALVDALKEASDLVAADPRQAVAYYVEDSKTKLTTDEILGFIADPRYKYFAQPIGTMLYADFMQRVGKIKRKATSWKDLFFPEIYDLNGS